MSEDRYAKLNGRLSRDAAQINEHLSSMTPDELLDELADKWDAMNDKDFDPHIIDSYLEALGAKEPLITNVDAETALAAFREKHSHLVNQMEPVMISSDLKSKPKRRRRLRVVYLIAATMVVMFGCMITAQALGVDVFGTIARWTEDAFQFGPAEQTGTAQNEPALAGEGNLYKNMHDALTAYDITEPVVPKWYPSGFQMGEIKVTSTDDSFKFQVAYESEERFFSITFWKFPSEEHAQNGTFEKDPSSVTVYEYGGFNHYLMHNNGQIRAAWTNMNIVCSISGDLTEDELKDMIKSIYER